MEHIASRPRTRLLATAVMISLLLIGIIIVMILTAALAPAKLRAGTNDNAGAVDNSGDFVSQLRFNANGRFKIVQFTDLHFGDFQGGAKDASTKLVQRAILEAEKPDLIAMSGDMVSGHQCKKYEGGCQAGWYEQVYKNVTEVPLELGYPWAIILGNHDVEADLNCTEIVALDKSYNLSRTQLLPAGPGLVSPPSTNYVLSIYSSSDPKKIVSNLWFFDSGNKDCSGVKGYSCVYPDVIAWYMQQSRKFTENNNGVPVPGVAFVHIPPPEFMTLYNSGITFGNKSEDVCCFSVNTGLVSAFMHMGDVKAVYVGHDHDNDYYGDYHGVTLGYGRKTGYGSYGPPAGWLRGSRVIELAEQPFGITMWIRQEDGSLVLDQPAHYPNLDAANTHQSYCCV